MTINKKFLKYAIITIIFATALFLTIHFGIKVRQLKLEEMAEQIDKMGFYKSDIYINIEREKQSLKYSFLATTPLLITVCIGIGNMIIDIFSNKK